MPRYTKDFEYSIHSIKSVTHQLLVIEEPDIANVRSKLTIAVIRNNSKDIANGGKEYLKLTINGSVVYDKSIDTPKPPAYGSDEVFTQTHYLTQETSKSFTVTANYKCDSIDGLGSLVGSVYYTNATATISGELTALDLSAPKIENFSFTSDRYGNNTIARFTATHSSYDITGATIVFSNLSSYKAWNIYYMGAGYPYADVSVTSHNNGEYYSVNITFRIDDITTSPAPTIEFYYNFDGQGKIPLESGGSYPYTITVKSSNGKETVLSGTVRVPQKITGVECESSLDLIPGQSVNLDYAVIPTNAEFPAVDFYTSDSAVATVDVNGKITAISEGICVISVVTQDKGSPDSASGFIAECIVNVLDKESFPNLNVIQYLSDREISKLDFACDFIFEKLTKNGVSVPALSDVNCKGKSHPIKKIKEVVETIGANCQKLKDASSARYPTSSLSGKFTITKSNSDLNWYIVINEWINFLNELNSKLN